MTNINDDMETPTSEVEMLEKQLLKTSWVKESELIQQFVPDEDLTKTQIKLLQKCIDKEDFTDNQFKELKLLLNKYRNLLIELKPQETLESVDETVQLIKTEQEFIDLMDSDEEKYLMVNLPTRKGIKSFEFEVLPIQDSRIVESLELHIDLFRDFDMDDATVYSNANAKNFEDLTEEEIHVVNRVNQLVAEKLSKQKMETADNFLAHQLRIKGSDADLETRKLFWSKFHFNAKFSIFIVVQNRLGLNEVSNQQLFPAGE